MGVNFKKMEEFIRFIDLKNFNESIREVSVGHLSDAFFSQTFFDYVEDLSNTERKVFNRSNVNMLLPITYRFIAAGIPIKIIYAFYRRRNWCTYSYALFTRKIRNQKENNLLIAATANAIEQNKASDYVPSNDTYEPIKVGDSKTESISASFIGGSLENTRARLKEVAENRERKKRQREQNKD